MLSHLATRPTSYLLAALLLLTGASLGGCGSSGQTAPSGAPTSSPSGSRAGHAHRPGATTSTAPAGLAVKSCPYSGLRPPEVRTFELSCAEGRAVAAQWLGKRSCSSPPGASRYSCTVRRLRCLGTSTERGIAVVCARPGHTVVFLKPS